MRTVDDYMAWKEASMEVIVLASKPFAAFCLLSIGFELGEWVVGFAWFAYVTAADITLAAVIGAILRWRDAAILGIWTTMFVGIGFLLCWLWMSYRYAEGIMVQIDRDATRKVFEETQGNP